jgi:hypothetical protein
MDNAAGLHDSDVIYVDTKPEQFESLPETALHRPVDLAVVGADKEGQSLVQLLKVTVDESVLSPDAIQAMLAHTSFYLPLSGELQQGSFMTSAFQIATLSKFPWGSRRAWIGVRAE